MAWAAFGMGALGRLVGNLSDTYGTGDTKKEKERKDAEHDYLQRERLGIQARVDGAKAAGLHPLVAMNYQGGNSPTQIIGGGGDIVPQGDFRDEPKSDPNIDRYNAARARLAEAEATKAERDLAAANRSLATQPGQGKGLITSDANAGLGGSLVIKPDEVVAGKGGLTAGTHPGMTRFEFPGVSGGLALPSAASSQAMEDLELLKYAAILSANSDRLWTALQEMNYSVGNVRQTPREQARREVDNLRSRHPPKGDHYISPRSRGGVVRY